VNDMSINKQCFYKSVKKDYADHGWIAVIILSSIIGWYTGWVYSAQISSFIISILTRCPSSLYSVIISLIIMMVIIIDVLLMSKERSKEEPVFNIISANEFSILSVYGICFILYIFYKNIANISINETNACMCELVISSLILTVVNVIISPIVLGYVRCKDEPKVG